MILSLKSCRVPTIKPFIHAQIVETSLKLFPTSLSSEEINKCSALEHENQSLMNFLYISIKLRFSWLQSLIKIKFISGSFLVRTFQTIFMSEFFSKTSCAQVAYLGPILYDLHFRLTINWPTSIQLQLVDVIDPKCHFLFLCNDNNDLVLED